MMCLFIGIHACIFLLLFLVCFSLFPCMFFLEINFHLLLINHYLTQVFACFNISICVFFDFLGNGKWTRKLHLTAAERP